MINLFFSSVDLVMIVLKFPSLIADKSFLGAYHCWRVQKLRYQDLICGQQRQVAYGAIYHVVSRLCTMNDWKRLFYSKRSPTAEAEGGGTEALICYAQFIKYKSSAASPLRGGWSRYHDDEVVRLKTQRRRRKTSRQISMNKFAIHGRYCN